MLLAKRDGMQTCFVLPPRGVVLFAPEALPHSISSPAAELSLTNTEWKLSLEVPNVRRVNFNEMKQGSLTLAGDINNVRIVTRDCAMSYAVTTSGISIS